MSVSLNEKFYRVIANIPEGRVASYGQVALLAGRPRAARAVGAALRHVPDHLELPCHRVVFSDGSLCKGLIFALLFIYILKIVTDLTHICRQLFFL